MAASLPSFEDFWFRLPICESRLFRRASFDGTDPFAGGRRYPAPASGRRCPSVFALTLALADLALHVSEVERLYSQ